MAESFTSVTDSFKPTLIERIHQLSDPLKPIPTDYPVKIKKISGIKSVVFDVYGTLLISASGDLGVTQKMDNENAFREALTAAGIDHHLNKAYIRGSDLILSKIQEDHEKQKSNGQNYPEVDIREIWKRVFESLLHSSLIDKQVTDQQLIQAAIEYECRINPTWPMPDLSQMIDHFRKQDITLGIVSNAQFYTPLLIETYLKRPLAELGFKNDLCFWSYQQQTAKPSVALYERIGDQLKTNYNISAEQVLYIGNDMLNDMTPASLAGFKTALFAGDKRSLRLREGNEACEDVNPDLVINRLMQLIDCLD